MKRVKAMGLGAMLLLLVLAVMLLLTRKSVSGFENSCIQKKVGDNMVCWCDLSDDKWPMNVDGLDYQDYQNYKARFKDACNNNQLLPCMPNKLSAIYKQPYGIDITSLYNMFDIGEQTTISNDDRSNIINQLIGIQSGGNCAK
jgi:hypothetical protein